MQSVVEFHRQRCVNRCREALPFITETSHEDDPRLSTSIQFNAG